MKKTTNTKQSPAKKVLIQEDEDDDIPECICCSDPIKVFSIGPCNHKDTCAMCNLKRRLLYKDQRFCPICREDRTPLILTLRGDLDHSSFDTSASAITRIQSAVAALAKRSEERIRALLLHKGAPPVPYAFHYTRHRQPSTPDALNGIFCSTPELAYSVSSLLEFSCPICSEALAKHAEDALDDPINPGCQCLVSFATLAELKKHLSGVHKMMYCDICLEEQKVFIREQHLFGSQAELIAHMSEWDFGVSDAMAQLADDQKEMYEKAYRKRSAGKGERGAKEGKWKMLVKDIQKGHPLCEFCDKRFYGADQLYAHLNGDHFVCPLCERIGKRWQYFRDMNDLLSHYKRAHFLCSVPGCALAFLDREELKAHELCAHGIGGKLVLEPSFHFGNHPPTSSSPSSLSSNPYSNNSRHNNNNNGNSNTYSPHFNGVSSNESGSKKKKRGGGGGGNGNGRSVSPNNTTSPKPHSQRSVTPTGTSSSSSSSSSHPQRSITPTSTSTTSSLHIVRPNNNSNNNNNNDVVNDTLPTHANIDDDDDDDDEIIEGSNVQMTHGGGIVASRGKTSFVSRGGRTAQAPAIKSRSAEAERKEREVAARRAEIEQRRRERQKRREKGAATYTIPETVSNKELITEMKECLSEADYDTFRRVSANFKNNVINADVYIKNFFEIFGGFTERPISIFLRLIAVLPDKRRQKSLLVLLNKKSLDIFNEQCKLDDIEERKEADELRALARTVSPTANNANNNYSDDDDDDDDVINDGDDDDDDVRPLRVLPQMPPQSNNPYGTSRSDMEKNFPALPETVEAPPKPHGGKADGGRRSPTTAERIGKPAMHKEKSKEEEFPPLAGAPASSPTTGGAPKAKSAVSYRSVTAAGQQEQQKRKKSEKESAQKRTTVVEEFPALRSSPDALRKRQQETVSKKVQARREQKIAYQKYIEKERQRDEYYDEYMDDEEEEYKRYVMEQNKGDSKLTFGSGSVPQQYHQQQQQSIPSKSSFPTLGQSLKQKKGGKKK